MGPGTAGRPVGGAGASAGPLGGEHRQGPLPWRDPTLPGSDGKCSAAIGRPYSRKNRLYQAFRELGRAVRTGFLLRYLGDAGLRSTIQAATNKSESFNDFVQWVAFGGGGVIAENDRGEQRKVITDNHLLANCLIFHNVCLMTRILHDLGKDGVPMDAEAVATFSPYVRAHINRFGRYRLDLSRTPTAIDYDLSVVTATSRSEGPELIPAGR